ncbi:magnesium transporter MgtE N-terminal domain-containing protein [Chroococcidiopsis sp. TS-821]|uniref:magnesium transporter MgtE N-terminal domain-containing protein n=1 Tax=Chroococcidiopsis sp. TS-821 TaxID=1378066 RepID=UPI00143CFB59|nr:hypothetical protein [Chroococcidiopsis sp. TS-821]
MTRQNLLRDILQQPTLEAMKQAVNQLNVGELVNLLPTVALNKRVLLFLLLEEPTALNVFRGLRFEEQLILLYAMETSEQNWLLNLLEPDEQAVLLTILRRGQFRLSYATART